MLAYSSQAREYLRRAKVFFNNGNLTQARNFFQRAEKIDPDDTEIQEFAEELTRAINERTARLQQQIEFYLSAKNLPEAEKLVSEMLSLSPDNEFAVEKLKYITGTYRKIEEYKAQGIQVSVDSGRAHDIDHYSAVSYFNRAQGFFDQGDRVNAMEMLNLIFKREPDHKMALALKARIEQVNEIETFVEKAETAFLEGRMLETVDALTVLIANSPERIEYLLLRGKAHLRLKNYDQALADLWKYFRFNQDEDTLFPLFSQCYYGQKNFLIALGFSYNIKTGKIYQSLGYRIECHIRAFFSAYFILLILILLIPVAVYYAWRAGEDLLMRFSLGSAWLFIKCIGVIAIKSPIDCLGDLITIARELNVPWLNYLVGICLFKIGQVDGAQRFLSYSLESGSLRSRAYYFVGLARKNLKYRAYENDFEESVLSGVGRLGTSWHPKFMKEIERELMMSYSKEMDKETFEGMAYAIVNTQAGE